MPLKRLIDMGFKNTVVVTAATSGPFLIEVMTKPTSSIAKNPRWLTLKAESF